jgi:ABC-2 type transport system permease protein
VTAGLAAATYLVDLLTPTIESVEWLQYLSPFHYYLDAEPMMNGLGVLGSVVLTGIAAVAFGYSLIAFERRDLAA